MIIVPVSTHASILYFQSNEVGGSYQMELEGLICSTDLLQEWGLDIGTLVTDRHRSVAKWVRKNLPIMEHLYQFINDDVSVSKF